MSHKPAPPSRLDPDEDLRLVGLCLGGDPRAWEALVRRHERLVYAVARSYRLADADAADVFQEVFAALVRGLPTLRDGRTLCRWLATTADRVAYATALRLRRAAAREAAGDESAPDALPADLPEVGRSLEELEQQALLRLALESLAERCRKLLAALYYEDPTPSYSEISRRFGVPVGSLGPTRARCFERLRETLTRLEQGGQGISEGEPPTSISEDPTSAPRGRTLPARSLPARGGTRGQEAWR